MDRKIKFRGKGYFKNVWYYGYYIERKKTLEHWICDLDEPILDVDHLIKKETLGQFTGFKDKNGKEIFEGDIFVDNEDKITSVVVFEDGCFKLRDYGVVERLVNESAYGEFWDEIDCQPLFNYNTERMEIVGNSFDNPDLLKPIDNY